MKTVVISGTGLFAPPETISNTELVESFNCYVREYNTQHEQEIANGSLNALMESNEDFIVKASGIKSRHVIEKKGILDIHRMCPSLLMRAEDELSLQAEMGVAAAKQAMENAKKTARDIEVVIVSCTNMQRPYPSMAIEIQQALGIEGYAFDMSVACSSATFGLHAAFAQIAAGLAKCILVVNVEIASAQVNFRDRESHFIFGDAATAQILETAESCTAKHAYEIVSSKLKTQYSNNIRCNFGFINRIETEKKENSDNLFSQQGRKVFKEVIPLVDDVIGQHLAECYIQPADLKRLWLHQANINMNRLIATKILGHEPSEKEAPTILDEFANTASVGLMIILHKYRDDLNIGDLGILCSFGAGYSIGNLILKKIS